MSTERMDFAYGKYTVINDNGILTALRHGEPWARDLVGDNLVYWMFVEARNLKSQCDELLGALKFVMSAHGEQLDLAFQQAQEVITKAEGKL